MENDHFLTREEAASHLTERGLRISKQTLARLAATSSDGPEYQIFGSRAVYRINRLNEWANAYISKPRRSSFETAAA
jgi:hypothetical protein